MSDRRLIEETFPVREVSAASVREQKGVRPGYISTLHKWWARRPLAASRATAYAALVNAPDTEEERIKERQFVIDLSQWENSENEILLERARQAIRRTHGGFPPRVLDCFAGRGTIPLEAMRLGCETYALDYNPLAVLLCKAVLEYPNRFGIPGKVDRETVLFGQHTSHKEKVDNLLVNAVHHWGQWMLEMARKELDRFYPSDPDGSIPIGYLWARTIPCQNPACGAEIPLMRQFWLSRDDNKRVALYPETEGQEVRFRIVGTGYAPWPEGFDPKRGTMARAVATCLICGATVDGNTVRRLFCEGQAGQRLVAVVLKRPGNNGKWYRVAHEGDMEAYQSAVEYLARKCELLREQWGIDPVPDEEIRIDRPSPNARGLSAVTRYNIRTYGQLFNARQNLTLVTFVEALRTVRERLGERNHDPEFAIAVATYLSLAIDRLAEYNSSFCRWNVSWEIVASTMDNKSLDMVWDYVEINPFGNLTGNWKGIIESIKKFIIKNSNISSRFLGEVTIGSATSLPWPDEYFDAVLTDPPYYDNVPYGDLSDFFYVWLKRSIGDLHPELFITPLTPKDNEMVADAKRAGDFERAKRRFEEMLTRSFQEIYRVLRPGGIAVIVYAHKTTAGWETLVNALLDSGLTVVASWPIDTELETRLQAQGSAALASSIYIVARKLTKEEMGFYPEVKTEMAYMLPKRLEQFWEVGLSGPDLLIAGIGTGLEVFGKYREVIDYEGTPVRADRILADVRALVVDFAIRQILHNGLAAELSERSRFYLLYRWCFGDARVEFDEVRKLAQAVGMDLAAEWSRRGSFVRKEREWVRILGPHERLLGDLEEANDLVDVLHRAVRHWEQGQREAIVELLTRTGWGNREIFWRVAQAVSACLARLSPESKERQLLDGLLAGRERLTEAVRSREQQFELFER